MFPNNPNFFTFTKIINGLSKTLSVASKIVPIYEQTKPLISGARKTIKKVQNIKTTPLNKNSKIVNTKKVIKNDNFTNNPSFFQ